MKGKTLLAAGEIDSKRLKQGEAEFRTAVQFQPHDPIFRLNLGISLLRQSKDTEGVQELTQSVELDPENPAVEQARELIADPRRARAEFGPRLPHNNLQGQDLTLKQLAGKIIVLDFWARWCPPCRASVGELKELTRRYSSDKAVLLSVSADRDENAWREFIAKKKMDWPRCWDSKRKLADSFSVRAYPTYLVIDTEGMVKQRIVGLDEHQTVVHRLKETLAAMPELTVATSK